MRIKESNLNNGINLLSASLSDSNSVTLLVLVKAGTSNEKIPGLAHFVEHTVFKGTLKRPSAFSINNEVERVGGYLNAETSQEYTEYYIKIPKEFLEKAFDILSDMLFNSIFDEKEIEKEKAVVIEEIKMYDDTPIRSVSDSFYSLVWNNALGRSILGTPLTVESIKRQDIVDFISTNYIPQNIIISVAGSINEEEVEELANKYFGNIRSKDNVEVLQTEGLFDYYDKDKTVKYIKVDNLNIRIEEKGVKQCHFCFGVRGLSYKNAEIYPLNVGGAILAEGSGSYLWQKIREELGASYYLNSEIDSFSDTGIWYIHSGVDDEKLYDVLPEVVKGFKKLIENDINAEELFRAKEYLKGDLSMGLEGSEEIARYIAHDLFEIGEVRDIEEEKRIFDSVKPAEVSDVVRSIFSDKIYFNILTKSIDENKLKEALSF